jgi:peptidoglycan/LPS O-acetylase OafA/YrhL
LTDCGSTFLTEYLEPSSISAAAPGFIVWPRLRLARLTFSNLTLFFQDWFLYLKFEGHHLVPVASQVGIPYPRVHEFLLVPPCWSLGVELTFYAIAPFVCRSFRRLLILFCIGFTIRVAIGVWQPWMYRFSPAEMMTFASGGLAYFAGTWLRTNISEGTTLVIGFACMILVSAGILLFPTEAETGFWYPLFVLNGPVLLFIVVACPFLLSVSLRFKWDAYIGELSYPMYLTHIFVYEALMGYKPDKAVYTLAVIAFSAILFWLVVQPFDKLRRGLNRRERAGLVVVVVR